VDVALATLATVEDPLRTGLGEISELLSGLVVPDDGTDGYLEEEVIPVATVGPLTLATLTILSGVDLVVAVVDKRVPLASCLEDQLASTASVAAVRAAAGNVLLSAEADGALATTTGANHERDFIYEAHWRIQR
jgi:hypothetical protein